jgi:hypothetical protein
MNSRQNLYDQEVDILWYSGLNDCHNDGMEFSYFAAYLDAINHECDAWQSAH